MQGITLKEYFSALGKKGRKKQAQRYTSADYKRWGAKGGRPRKKKGVDKSSGQKPTAS